MPNLKNDYPENQQRADGLLPRLVRWLTVWAWQSEITKAKGFDRVRSDKWRYRVALEAIIELSRGMPDDAEEILIATAALYPPNTQTLRPSPGAAQLPE